MGMFLRQDEQQTEVQKKVATELQERLRNAATGSNDIDPAYLENQHTTRKAGVVMAVLIGLLFIGLVAFAFSIS